MTYADWIKLAVMVLTVVGSALPILAKQKAIAKSDAWTKAFGDAQAIVSQIEGVLQENPGSDLNQLIANGVTEFKVTWDKEIALLGIPAPMVDTELALLLQRYSRLLPGIAGKIASDIGTGLGGAGTVMGANYSPRVGAVRKSFFARPLGLQA
jgi:hypothetical protein